MYTNLCGKITILLVLFLSSVGLNAQVSGVKTIPTDYATIAAFVADVNTLGVGIGGVTLNVPAGHTEVAPATGIQLTATGTSANPIIIQKSGSGANPVITAGLGTATPGSAIQDGVFALVGSDFVTIDGVDISDPNSTNPATMEWGYGLFKASATDGCRNNVIKNCVITLSRANNANGSGPSFEGSKGINVMNTLIATQTTSLTITAASGSNSFNQFFSNTIQNVNYGIALSGFADVTPFANADTGNDIGGASLSTGNTIINFGGAAAALNPSAAIRTGAQYNFNISYNTIDNTAGGGVPHVNTFRGINVGAATSASGNINYNNVIIRSGATTSLLEGISNASGSTAASNTINMTFNSVQVAYPTATTGQVNAIVNTGSAATVNINNNTVSNISTLSPALNVLAGTGTMVMISGGSGVTMTMNNNVVSNLTRTSATSGTFRAIVFASPTNLTVTGNTVENLSYTNPTSTGFMDGIYGLSSSVNVTISNNSIHDLFTPTTGTINGIREFGAAGTKNILNNEVYNFGTSNGGNGGATFNGIFCSTGTVTISGNVVYALNSSGITGGTGGVVTGINISSSSAPWTISGNKIYNLTTNSTSSISTVVNGILASSGSGAIFNNVIGELYAPFSAFTDAIRGISLTSSTPTVTSQVYFNSVYLNATSAGANFGTTGLFHTGSTTATTAVLDFRNNIIINESTPNGTGLVVAFRRATAASTNMSVNSNRNLLYAGVPSASRLIYTDGTAQQTLSGFQAVALPAGHNANSISGEAPFITAGYGVSGNFFSNLSGSSTGYLKPVASILTQAESGAAVTTSPIVSTDYEGSIRGASAGYTGSGTNPDMGAYEFNGVSPAPAIVLNNVTPPTSAACVASSRVVSVSITTISGTVTGATLNYAFNGVAQTPISMTNTSGNVWEGTIPVGSPLNATVTWNIVASNSLPLSSTYNGATYSDEPLTGITASIVATSAITCSGAPTNLLATLTNSNIPTYTAPTAVVSPLADEDLRNITITQGSTTLLNNTTNYNTLIGTIGTATGTAGSYSNFTSFPSTNLVAGTTYGLSATVADSNDASYYSKGVGVYIDYNRNGLFNDPGENVYVSPVSPTPQTSLFTFTGSFTVPTSVSNGLTRMRVVVNEGAVTGPTMLVSYGEFEEYSILLSGSGAGITAVSWSDGVTTVGTGNPLTVNPTTTTTYTASITSAGCTVSPAPTTTITVNPLPSAVTGTNSAQCGTQIPTATIASTTGATAPTFKWYDAATGGNVMQNSTSTTYTSPVTSTTTFHVSEVNATTGCESPRTAVTVTVAVADGIAAATSNATICIGQSITLTASNTNPTPLQTYVYTWAGTANSGVTSTTGASLTATPSLPGTYTYNLSGVDGGCNAVASVNVTVNPFVAAVTAVDATCNGVANGSFTLTSSSCGTLPYTYSIDGGTSFGSIPTNLAAGAYTVIVKDANNYVTNGQAITIGQPSITITNPTVTNASVCVNGTSAQVGGTAAVSTPTPGSVTVTFGLAAQPTEVSGASSFPTVAASPNIIMTGTIPALPAGATITGANFTFPGLTALGFSWRSDMGFGFTGSVTAAYAAGTGAANSAGVFDYIRTLAAGAINAAGGTVNVHYYDLYNDNTGAEATFPTGTSVATLVINYTTPTPATISWWDAATGGNQIGTGASFETVGTSVVTSTANPGVYTLYAQGQNGACPSPGRTATTVTVNALPIVNAGADFAVCAGGNATLNGSGATNYAWTGSVTNNVAFVPASTATYTVTGTDANGCSNTDNIVLTVNPLPIVSGGIDQTVCFGTAVALTGTGAPTITWNNGVTNTVPFTPTTTGTYTVTGTDANNCSNTDIVVVNVNALPAVNAGNNITICYGDSVTLFGTGAVSYNWNNSVVDSVGFVALSTTTYTVTGTDANGCVDTDNVTVSVNALPPVNAGTNLVVCQNGQASVNATGAQTYVWTNGVQNNIPFAVPATITLTVTGTDANGCVNTDDITISASPLPTVDAGANIIQCGDQNVTLTATGATYYTWNNGVQDGVAFNAPFGVTSYIVIGVDTLGCSGSDVVNVTINEIPTATVTAANALTLVATPSNGTFQWIDCATNTPILGATGSTFTATDNGSYAVIVTTGAGCADTSDCAIIDEVGLDNLDMTRGVTLYPNPTNGDVTVTLANLTNVSAEVYDAQGKLVNSITTLENGTIIELSSVQPGVYMIRLSGDNFSSMERIVKN
jgi:hypothetical protein